MSSDDCCCWVKHAISPEERVQARQRLAAARAAGDTKQITIELARLCRCLTEHLPMRKEANVKTRLSVNFNGRLRGAIGVTYAMHTFVTVEKKPHDITEQDVRLALCDDFENVSALTYAVAPTPKDDP